MEREKALAKQGLFCCLQCLKKIFEIFSNLCPRTAKRTFPAYIPNSIFEG